MESKWIRVSALALCAALVLSACGGDDPEPEPEASVASASPSPTPEPTCPMSGEAPSDPAYLERPAIAVKIENSPEARPQTGLEDADVVFEEIVEGGITRFMAIYQCHPIDQAGPVRSARFDDPKLALPFTHALAFSGANAIVERELLDQGLTILNETTSAGALFRDPPGSYDVHSLYANVVQLLKTARKAKLDPPAADLFTFGDLSEKAKKAHTVTINFNASNTIEYKWEGGEYKRYEAGAPFMSSAGSQIGVGNLVIMQVDVNNSPDIVDVAGNPSPDIDLINKGKAFLFRDGKVTKAKWSIAAPGEPPVFTSGGEPLSFTVAPIWIELVPSQKGTVKGSFKYTKR